jgi:hypothetical protein
VEANGCAFGACAIGGRSTRRHRYVLVLASLMAMWSPHQTMLRAVVGSAMVGGHREARCARAQVPPSRARSLVLVFLTFLTFVGGEECGAMRRECDAGRVRFPFHVGSCVAVAVRATPDAGAVTVRERGRGLGMRIVLRCVGLVTGKLGCQRKERHN